MCVQRSYKFTGKERDAESGLDNFGACYFTSSMGRFMSPDWDARPTAVPYAVFGDPQSLNLYNYVRNDPVTRADADGHCGNDTPNCKKLPKNPVANVSAPVKQAINNSVQASKHKTADDKKGGSHEEGGIAYTKNGTQVVAPAQPGQFKDVKQQGKVEINPFKAADPSKTKAWRCPSRCCLACSSIGSGRGHHRATVSSRDDYHWRDRHDPNIQLQSASIACGHSKRAIGADAQSRDWCAGQYGLRV